MLQAALKNIRARWVRLLFTSTAIIAGVAFVSGSFVLTDTLKGAFDDLFGTVYQGIDVTVRSASPFEDVQALREPVPESLLDTVRAVPGVEEAQGSVFRYAQFVGKDGDPIAPQAPTFGTNYTPSDRLSIAVLRDGRPPEGPGEVAMDAGTAKDHDFAVGDRVKVLFLAAPPEEFTIVGTFGFEGTDTLLGATIAAFDTTTAQRVLGAEGVFDSIDVAGGPGTDRTALAAAIGAALPAGYEAITQQDIVQESQDLSSGFLDIFNVVLLVFAGIAVFVGAFIIANTFSIIVAQRVREMALLRAVGATGGQVTAMVMVETLVIAVIASALGVLFGVVVAIGLRAALSGLGVDLPSTAIVFKPRTAIIGMAVGIIVTTVAAVLPAWRAAQVPPIAAMRDVEIGRERSRGQRLLVGGGAILVGIVAIVLGLFVELWNPLALVGIGALAIFLGVGDLSPLMAERAARIIGWPARRLLGMTGKLARENAVRKPTRTAATAGALMVGLALVSFAFVFGSSLKASAGQVIADSLTSDFVVQSAGSTGGPPLPLSPEVAVRMEALPEISVATGVRSGVFQVDGTTRQLGGIDPGRIEQVAKVDTIAGSLADLDQPDTISVRKEVAEEQGWSVGSTIDAAFVSGGTKTLRIVAIYEAEEALVGNYNVSQATFDANFTDAGDIVVLADIAAGSTPEQARSALESLTTDYPNLEIQDQAEFRQQTEDQVNQLLGIVTALLGLALFIALLGITNTLALSVYERTREIGLLRAVGMSRRQTRQMVRYEALIVAVFGAVLGILVGTVFGWLVVRAAADLGFSVFDVPYGQLAFLLVLAGGAGILAASGPARRAAKLDVLEAIAYE